MKHLFLLYCVVIGSLCKAQNHEVIRILEKHNDPNKHYFFSKSDLDSIEVLNIKNLYNTFAGIKIYKCKIYLTMGYHRHHETCLILYSTQDSQITIQKPYYWVGLNENFWNKLISHKHSDSSVHDEQLINVATEILYKFEYINRMESVPFTFIDSISKSHTYDLITGPLTYSKDSTRVFCDVYEKVNCEEEQYSKTGYIYVPVYVLTCEVTTDHRKKIKLVEY